MEIAELEIFVTVAREQSVTRAAHALARVQSNVTTRLRQLEERLGVSLFLRDNKRMTLTQEGERFLVYAQRILGLVEESRQAMHGDRPSGRLRIGSMETSAASRLPRPLARYHARWPEVDIAIHTGDSQALADAVLGNRLDCAIVAHPTPGAACDADMGVFGGGLQGAYLFTEKLMLVLPAGHPNVRSVTDVQVRSLAAFAPGCTYRRCAEQWLGAQGGAGGRWHVIEMASYHAIMACVMAGTAMAVLPQSVLDVHRDAPDVSTVFLRDAHSFLISRAGFDTAAYTEFLRELHNQSA